MRWKELGGNYDLLDELIVSNTNLERPGMDLEANMVVGRTMEGTLNDVEGSCKDNS